MGVNVLRAEKDRASARRRLDPARRASMRSDKACTSGSSGTPSSLEVALLKPFGKATDRRHMRSVLARSILVMAVTMAVLIPAQSAFAFSDVPNNYWDYNQIKYVAIDHTRMQDYGPEPSSLTPWRPGASSHARWSRCSLRTNRPTRTSTS